MGASQSKLPTEKLAPSDLLVKDSEPKLKSSKISFTDEKNSLKSSTGPASTAIKSETSIKSGSAAVTTAVATKKFQNKTLELFLHAAFDFDAPRPQNTHQK